MAAINEALFPGKYSSTAGRVEAKSQNRAKKKAESQNKQALHLDTLKVPRASELVADTLRALIVSGQAGPGSSFPTEKELVIQLGVSRATLREALRILEVEGLITTKTGPKGGIVVQHPNTANLTRSLSLLLQLEDAPFSAISEARRLLEPLCANLAAARASTAELAELEASLEAMQANLGDTARYVQEQLRFHLAIFAAAHNAVLRLYTTAVGDLITARTTQVGLSEAAQKHGLKAAEGILAALQEHNGPLAARRVEAHLRAFEAVLQQTEGHNRE